MANVKRAWTVVTKTVAVPGTAENLSSVFVPEGHTVTITNRRESSGNIYLGTTKTGAETDSTRKILIPGQSMSLQIMDFNLLWIDADNATDTAEIVATQD